MATHPGPEPLELPAPEQDWLPWVDARAAAGLAEARAQAAQLVEQEPGDPAALHCWNDVETALGDVLSLTSLVGAVHPDPAVTGAAERLEVEARELAGDLRRDDAVFARLSEVDAGRLDAAGARVLAHALRSFRRAGVDLDPADRERLRLLDRRADELGQEFSRRLRDARLVTRVPRAALEGLPEDYREAHPAGDDGLVEVSTDYPDTLPFLTHSRDAAARREVARAAHSLGWPENDAVLGELLRVRRDRARLAGYADWPTYDAEVKMVGTGAAIADFVEELAAATDAAGRAELAELEAVARAAGDDGPVDYSSWRHHAESLKRERFGVDSQAVRRYLDAGRVRDGLLGVTGRLFGLRYEPVDVATWHPEVHTYDVLDEASGERLGRVHLDLHPRAGKYRHAAQFSLVSGLRDRRLPQGALVCNFSRGLMEPDHVVTLFHEFGHLLHHVLAGRHDWAAFSGVATEWDFVEAPSQLLEEWAWDAEVLRGFAVDAAGEPIPAGLVERMRAADTFGQALATRTQLSYAAISYWFHQDPPEDLTARLEELVERYGLLRLVPGTHFHAGFGHLVGYGSGYYTYTWSRVIAKDLFSAFDADDLFAPEVAARYRREVLEPGGSRDAHQLVESFLGRPYDAGAFRRWLVGAGAGGSASGADGDGPAAG